MSLDFEKIQLSARNSSLKLIQQGSGTLTVPHGSTTPGGVEYTEGTVTIPHNYGSDELLCQVALGTFVGGAPGMLAPQVTPARTIWIFAHLNETNLYITGGEARPGGVTAEGYSVAFYYRLLVP